MVLNSNPAGLVPTNTLKLNMNTDISISPGFIKTDILEKISFPDHYNYSDKELENLINKAKENNTILLTTEKDYLRIEENYKKNINYLKIVVEIENRNQFIEEIKKVI